jgi:hypothetical protein
VSVVPAGTNSAKSTVDAIRQELMELRALVHEQRQLIAGLERRLAAAPVALRAGPGIQTDEPGR